MVGHIGAPRLCIALIDINSQILLQAILRLLMLSDKKDIADWLCLPGITQALELIPKKLNFVGKQICNYHFVFFVENTSIVNSGFSEP